LSEFEKGRAPLPDRESNEAGLTAPDGNFFLQFPMSFHIFNSFTARKEPFLPKDPGHVTLYNCGPTVYNYNHIGNFRSYLFVDLLRRYLKFRGYRIEHTSNITDIDDKIIENALASHQKIGEFTKRYIDAFFEDLKTLQIEEVEHRPRATESIPEMIELMQALDDGDHTYLQDGNLYFRIKSFSDYGKLSKIPPEMLRQAAGGRFEADEYTKEDVRDFALWKAPTRKDEPSWESPWGKGRPGWHLECSAMVRKIYGTDGVDIHIGGIDLLFPHHENEIAQSCAAYPHDNFARYWMHNEHLLVDSRKMSKSLGNYYTLRDLTEADRAKKLVEEKRAPAELLDWIEHGRIARNLRYLLLSVHYRAKLNFTFENLHAADSACDRIQVTLLRLLDRLERDEDEIAAKLRQIEENETPGEAGNTFAKRETLAGKAMRQLIDAMDDDLNVSKGLAALFDLIRELNGRLDDRSLSDEEAEDGLLFFYKINTLFDVLDFSPRKAELGEVVSEEEAAAIQTMIEQRNEARKQKDFALADQIRNELLEKGIRLIDTPQGSDWERV